MHSQTAVYALALFGIAGWVVTREPTSVVQEDSIELLEEDAAVDVLGEPWLDPDLEPVEVSGTFCPWHEPPHEPDCFDRSHRADRAACLETALRERAMSYMLDVPAYHDPTRFRPGFADRRRRCAYFATTLSPFGRDREDGPCVIWSVDGI